MKIKTRFAPSPTGHLHLGNVRTALFSALYAKANQGIFLLRIEDTDFERSKEEFVETIYGDLKWLGLDWQEGPGEDLGHGPYSQSQREAIYHEYYQKLETLGVVYPCFCSEKELAISRKAQLAAAKPPRYSGKCLSLKPEEIAKKRADGEKPSLRFNLPKGQTLKFLDFVKGEQIFNTDDIGDFIIRRADGKPTFMFCNAIDDAMMEVTHVLRGEDHLTNTARQILILKTLGLNVPEYGHLSLIMGDDGAPLSKRHGSSSILDMQQDGVLPIALVNYLARLGHHYEDNNLLEINELSEKFNLNSLSKSAAKFDPIQLRYWQKLALSHLSAEAMWAWMGDEVHHLVPPSKQHLFIESISPNVEFPEDALHWALVFFSELSMPDEEKAKILTEAGQSFFEEALKVLEEIGDHVGDLPNLLKARVSHKGKQFFMPLRVALTGELHGPKLDEIFLLLGKESVKHRFKQAMNPC